ncbi:hypothetical protein ACLOJK_005473 [Asimina triloba]
MHFPATLSGGDPGLDALELRYLARYRNPARMVEAVLALCFAEQLREQGMVEVDDRHQDAMWVVVFSADVDGEMALRHRNRLWVEGRPIYKRIIRRRGTPAGTGKTETFGEAAAPAADFRHRLLVFWTVVLVVQADVAGDGAPADWVEEKPTPEPEDFLPEAKAPESSHGLKKGGEESGQGSAIDILRGKRALRQTSERADGMLEMTEISSTAGMESWVGPDFLYFPSPFVVARIFSSSAATARAARMIFFSSSIWKACIRIYKREGEARGGQESAPILSRLTTRRLGFLIQEVQTWLSALAADAG